MKQVKFTAAAFLLLAGLCGPLFAASFSLGDATFDLGGDIRTQIGVQLSDTGDQPKVRPAAVPGDQDYMLTLPQDSVTDFFLKEPGTSRVHLAAKYGQARAFVELGLKANGNICKRHAYATLGLDDNWSLLVGHTWSLLGGYHNSTQKLYDDLGLKSTGKLYSGRNPQVRLNTKTGKLSASLAIEDNDTPSLSGLTNGSYIIDQKTPALLGSLTYKPTKAIKITPSFLVQQYEMTANTLILRDIDVTAWAVALDGQIKHGPIWFDYQVWHGNNVGIFASCFDKRPGKSSPMGRPRADALGRDIEDVASQGGWVQISCPLAPKLRLFTGCGLQKSEVEDPDPTDQVFFESNTTTRGAFVNLKYSITKQFFVQPELLYLDWGNDARQTLQNHRTGDNDLGREILAGAHVQFNF